MPMMLCAFRSYHSMPKWMPNCHPAKHGLAEGGMEQVKVKAMPLCIACLESGACFLQGSLAFLFV